LKIFKQTLSEIFSSNLDFTISIAITILIKNPIRINQTLILFYWQFLQNNPVKPCGPLKT